MTKCPRSKNFKEKFKLQKWFKYKNGVKLNVQDNSLVTIQKFGQQRGGCVSPLAPPSPLHRRDDGGGGEENTGGGLKIHQVFSKARNVLLL